MIKQLAILCITFLTLSCCAMEYAQKETNLNLMTLPKELKCETISFLLNKNNIRSSLQDLITLAQADTSFNKLIRKDGPFSLQKLAKKLDVTPRAIVLHLISLGALNPAKELAYPANTDLDGQLIKAMDHANDARVLWLLEQNADVNAKNRDRPALIAGSANGSYTKVKALIAYGANINIQDDFKNTALHAAASHQQKDVVNLLIASNCAINIQNKDHGTALIQAIMFNNEEDITRSLLEAGADVHTKYRGLTALHYATIYGKTKIANLLKEYGATE